MSDHKRSLKGSDWQLHFVDKDVRVAQEFLSAIATYHKGGKENRGLHSFRNHGDHITLTWARTCGYMAVYNWLVCALGKDLIVKSKYKYELCLTPLAAPATPPSKVALRAGAAALPASAATPASAISPGSAAALADTAAPASVAALTSAAGTPVAASTRGHSQSPAPRRRLRSKSPAPATYSEGRLGSEDGASDAASVDEAPASPNSNRSAEHACELPGELALRMLAQARLPSVVVRQTLEASYYKGSLMSKSSFARIAYGQRLRDSAIVAIKTFRQVVAWPSILSEVLFLERCQHPNIVRALDVFHSSDASTLVLNWGGVPVMSHPSWPLWTPQTKGLICQRLLDGLVHMHSLHVVHCDVHANNVLTSPLDFCTVGQVMLSGFRHCQLARTGSPDWEGRSRYDHCPPEVGLRKSHLDGKEDSWSFGILLFLLACNRRLVKADSTTTLPWRVALAIGPPPAEDLAELQSLPAWNASLTKRGPPVAWMQRVRIHMGAEWADLLGHILVWAPSRRAE